MAHSTDPASIPGGDAPNPAHEDTVLSDPEIFPKSSQPAPEPEPESSSELTGSPSGRVITSQAHDSLLARLIIDKGLATPDEIERCKQKRANPGFLGRRRTLAQVLVEQQAITPNQLARLEQLIEKQRSSRTIPGFKMLGKLGKGTTATVYKARQLNLDRLVAIKVLPPASFHSEKAVQQFYFEGRAAAQLNHPNVVQAFDVGQWVDCHYFVMEYVEGKTVHDMLQERGRIPPEESLQIVCAVAEALRHAHERGFVHRDVKPKNIIIDPQGVAKLADLGLARGIADREAGLAEKGHALGTPYYISPEQVRGEVEIGPAADVYGLGATFYHMVTGQPPFLGTDAKEVMTKHLVENPRPPIEVEPKLPPGLSEVIEKMLKKEPLARYADCELLLLDLYAWRAVFTLQRGEAETGRGYAPPREG